jgi:hypothetical protein
MRATKISTFLMKLSGYLSLMMLSPSANMGARGAPSMFLSPDEYQRRFSVGEGKQLTPIAKVCL